ncbi:MAG: response regulator-like [Erysipelotrichaceae bacterium]|nr:MAG: response regulator-like [Erysipelotrichaceae bacterium]
MINSSKKQETQPLERDLLNELNIANKEIANQLIESKKNEKDLVIVEKKLATQTEEKETLADELSVVNKELVIQKKDKKTRTKELGIVKTELALQNAENEDLATELVSVNKELIFQKDEKKKRTRELKSANKELVFQANEKQTQTDKFIIIKKAIISQAVEIENLTYQNQMNGLNNRKYFLDALARYDLEANLPISIIMCEINGLAIINHSLGHFMADEILTRIIKILSRVVRTEDVSICFSSGEFALILPKTNMNKSNRIVKKLKAFTSNEKAGLFDVSISCGTQTKLIMSDSLDETVKIAQEKLNIDRKIEGTIVENNTIGLIMEMLFEKNNREMLHSSRVSNMCERLAQKLHFDQGVVARIRATGMLHDIGKIGIDEKILNESGKLNEHEWAEIKKHPEIGYRILSASNEFIIHAKDVLQHHERIDGTGYPNGIKGEEISLVAKIISIVDAYDALISERPYRKALCEKDAIEEIIRCSGSQFDTELVKVFVEMIREHGDFKEK